VSELVDRRRVRTECRVLVDRAEPLLERDLNALLAQGWHISHLSTAVVGDDYYVTVLVQRQRVEPAMPATRTEGTVGG
jgi:hypothetical protein